MTFELTLYCADCAGERVFAAVECAEDHEHGCPELACSACGAAVLLAQPAGRRNSPAALRHVA